jgi:hypothetical protein
LETQLGFPQRKQQPKIKGQNLHQEPPILGAQGIALNPLNQGFPFFPTQVYVFWLFHSGSSLDRHTLSLECSPTVTCPVYSRSRARS